MKRQTATLLIALSLAGCGEATSSDATTSAPTTSAPAPRTTLQPTTSTEPVTECSASGLTATIASGELPDAVVSARVAVLEAALACDFAELARLAANSPFGFSYSFGEGGEPEAYWMSGEASGSEALAALVAILNMSSGQSETQFQTDVYTPLYFWPAAFGETATDAQWTELEGLYTKAELDQMKQYGAYAGWRTGFTADGDWVFFIAGD